jgi:hypothetical protein
MNLLRLPAASLRHGASRRETIARAALVRRPHWVGVTIVIRIRNVQPIFPARKWLVFRLRKHTAQSIRLVSEWYPGFGTIRNDSDLAPGAESARSLLDSHRAVRSTPERQRSKEA